MDQSEDSTTMGIESVGAENLMYRDKFGKITM